MRFDLVLLAALPGALAATAYTAPPAFAAKVAAASDCELPSEYHIQNFAAKSKDSGKTLSSYGFTFVDATDNLKLSCQFNSTSKPTAGNGGLPRYACDHADDVTFIWEDGDRDLTMIRTVCPAANGAPVYEVSGSIRLTLACAPSTGNCMTNSTDSKAVYSSISPVRNPPSLA